MNNTANSQTDLSYAAMGRDTGAVSSGLYLLLGLTILYFSWRDLQLYINIQHSWSCTNNSSASPPASSLSVKYLLQPPTIHYVELPLSEMLERSLSLSHFISPNSVSLTGLLLGQLSALLIARGGRLVVVGVLVYKVRDLLDSLDGVLARGLGTSMVPTPGTGGYYLDGWCDILSESALIYSVALLIHRERSRSLLLTTKTSSSWIWKLFGPLSWEVLGLGLQGILSAVAWNWTTEQLHFILETQDRVSIKYLTTPRGWLVVFLWRLLNPHMLTQALLASLLLDRPAGWVEVTKYVVTPPLLCLSAYSYLLVYTLRGDRT